MALTQNLQLHYDFGRQHLTSTCELYKTDRLGATFLFVDFDYNNEGSSGSRNASLAYGEIARYFQLPKMNDLSATLQYNDGLTNSGSFNSVWLEVAVLLFSAMGHPKNFYK